jgi:hypothetical protein
MNIDLDALFAKAKRPTPEDDVNVEGVTKCRVLIMNQGVVSNEKVFNHRAYYMMKRFRAFWERDNGYAMVEVGMSTDDDLGAHWWLIPFGQDRCIKCYDIEPREHT